MSETVGCSKPVPWQPLATKPPMLMSGAGPIEPVAAASCLLLWRCSGSLKLARLSPNQPCGVPGGTETYCVPPVSLK